MAANMYALDPGYYSRQLGGASKKKRFLTGRGMTEEEALSGYYADIAARQAEMDAASLRKARQRQLDLEQSKLDISQSQFGKELEYKYAALDKEAALAGDRTALLRQQLENQEKAQMVQGILTGPTALARAVKGGKDVYDWGKGVYDWLNPSPEAYSLPGAAGPEEYFAGANAGGDAITAGTTAADAATAGTTAATSASALTAADAGGYSLASYGAAAPEELFAAGTTAGAEGAALTGSTALSAAGGFAGAVAAPLAVLELAKIGVPAITNAIFGKGTSIYDIPTEELWSNYSDEGGKWYKGVPQYRELARRGYDVGGLVPEKSAMNMYDFYSQETNRGVQMPWDWNWDTMSPGASGMGFDASFGGAAAEGGDFLAGGPVLVGERGPEVIIPKSDMTVIPNHQIPREIGGRPRGNINTGMTGSLGTILKGIGGIF